MQITLWSIVAAAQVALNGKASFYACRALIGALEGGFIPDLILWLSYFYKSGELTMRLSWFWISRYVTMVVTSVMAFGLLRMRGVAGLEGWRWLFLIEGLITFAIGIASFFMMPASATQTKTWFRPKGKFTNREVGIVVNRVLRDDPTKGDMNNRTGLSLKNLWDAVADWDLWPVSLINKSDGTNIVLTQSLDLLHRTHFHDPPKYTRSVHHTDTALTGIRPGRRTRTRVTLVQSLMLSSSNPTSCRSRTNSSAASHSSLQPGRASSSASGLSLQVPRIGGFSLVYSPYDSGLVLRSMLGRPSPSLPCY